MNQCMERDTISFHKKSNAPVRNFIDVNWNLEWKFLASNRLIPSARNSYQGKECPNKARSKST